MKITKVFFFGVLLIALASCAKRGSISGGLKDTIPPTLKSSFPNNYSTEFSGNSIRLNFDEYVKLKDVNKQLIISPPQSKSPQITPLTASKTVTISFLDSLRPNTTYSLNFGKSIEDNNEGNPLAQFKYVFSTGKYIDSLTIKGSIKDALEKKSSSPVTIMLYEINEKHTDSAVYKDNPSYIAFSQEADASFIIDNIKAGKYQLVALEEKSANYRFNPKTEKIGFRKTPITIPNDSVFELKLFKEIGKLRINLPSQSSACSAIIGYEGNAIGSQFTLKKGAESIPFIVSKIPKKDSLQIWFKPFKIEKADVDSLHLTAVNGDYRKDFTFKIRAQKRDSLNLSLITPRILPLNEDLLLRTNIPIAAVDETKISLIKKDSTIVPIKLEYDELNLIYKVIFTKDPLEKYTFKLPEECLTDFTGKTNTKPMVFEVETKNTSDYGNLRVEVENLKQFPVIVELTDKDGVVKYSAYSIDKSQIDFNLIEPNLYTLRLIYDTNGNKVWDPGNYLDQKQPEDVIYFPKELDVRANWDVQQSFILK